MTLKFDPAQSYLQHMAAFKAYLEALDPECAKIFFDNQSTLQTRASPRDRQSRTAFNSAVQKVLDGLPQSDKG